MQSRCSLPMHKLLSKAKINLGLNVLFKRPDNYHEIRSIMVKLNWGDDMEIQPIRKGKFELISENKLDKSRKHLYDNVSENGDLTQNILYKAYKRLQSFFPDLPGAKIFLTKKIPPGGGLGGGSSNAAALLLFLFEQFKIGNLDNLIRIASEIGADIPFFLIRGNALASRIGEVLEEIEVSQSRGVLAIPPFMISTAESFKNLNLALQKNPVLNNCNILSEEIKSSLRCGDWDKLKIILKNDFEDYAFRVHPSLKLLKDNFYHLGCSYASMTGTGSCVYGISQSLKVQEEVHEKLVRKYPDHQFIKFTF